MQNLSILALFPKVKKAGEQESEPNDLVEAGTILFFLQVPERESEHFKKLEWSRSWSWSWHKLMRP